MNSPSRIHEAQNGKQFAAVSRGGGAAHAADFRAALANAVGTAGSSDNQPVAADRGNHVVKSGETLYGIARSHLAATGQPATPSASMRYALQIAKANQIRNPDRIHAGQQLDLAAVAAPISVRSDAVTKGIRSAALSTGAGTRPHNDSDWRHLLPETQRQQDAGEHDYDVAEHPLSTSVIPVEGCIKSDAAMTTLVDNVEAARVDLALYEQTSPAFASKLPVELPDIFYKGVAGKVLDMVPLEPSTRTGLQQASAVVGNSLVGRSLAALTGVGGPILTVAGLLWGIFSAQKINAMQSGEK